MKLSLSNINFRQPKYILPAILYLPLIGVIYLFVDLFHTQKADISSGNMEKTEYVNPNLPSAQIKGDGIGRKMSNMATSFGNISDLSAVDDIAREELDLTEEYESRYTEEELQALLEAERIRQESRIADSIRMSIEAEYAGLYPGLRSDELRMAEAQREQQQLQDEMNAAIAAIRAQSSARVTESVNDTVIRVSSDSPAATGSAAVTAVSEEDETKTVTKKVRETSEYFNTLSSGDDSSNLITAIIDENVKAVDGSRIRLRLLDDIEIDGYTVPSGSYLYATWSGFGSQRVTGEISSILVSDRLMKVNLSIYDLDGLAGLYVPQSQFRETGKDVASSAFQSGSLNMGYGSGDNLRQMGTQSLQNAYQRVTNAVSKAIRQNQAHLKYGTFVYLINERNNN